MRQRRSAKAGQILEKTSEGLLSLSFIFLDQGEPDKPNQIKRTVEQILELTNWQLQQANWVEKGKGREGREGQGKEGKKGCTGSRGHRR